MHLNLTLSAPGGPGSSWGDRENPKPRGAGGGGCSASLCSLRFAAHLPPVPAGRALWGAGRRRFRKLVERGRR